MFDNWKLATTDTIFWLHFWSGVDSHAQRSVLHLYPIDSDPISDELTTLRRENEDLKLQLGKLKTKLKEIERYSMIKSSSAVSSPLGGVTPSSDKPPLPRKSFINSVSKKLGRLYPFVRDGVTPTGSKGRVKPPKDRRHSVSWYMFQRFYNRIYKWLAHLLFY